LFINDPLDLHPPFPAVLLTSAFPRKARYFDCKIIIPPISAGLKPGLFRMSLQKVPAWTQAGTFCKDIRRAASLQKYANPLAIYTVSRYNENCKVINGKAEDVGNTPRPYAEDMILPQKRPRRKTA